MRVRVALCVSVLLVSPVALADTYIVTKTADTNDGVCNDDCSLREAIAAANARSGPDVIRLRHSFYRLTVHVTGPNDSDLTLGDTLTIRGLPERSTIDANGTNRHFQVLSTASVELVDLTLRNGAAQGRGGSIHNRGSLVLRRVWVLRNRVTADADGVVDGGGLWNAGMLRLIECKVDSNVAQESPTGGHGGGIYNAMTGELYVYDTLIRNNLTGADDAAGFGAGLYNRGRARVDRSFFGANDPGDGEGGAIANRFGGSLALVNSTLSNNGHDGADGALANGSILQATEEAGFIAPRATVVNSTIANNNGGGVLNTGEIALRQAIVAGNYSQDVHDRIHDSGRNCRNEPGGEMTQVRSLITADGNCPAYITLDNSSTFDLVLEHLRYLGGPTPVHKPRPGPYAIDNGDGSCPSDDQRRAPRPADGDGDGVAACDLGAMEVGP